MPARIPWRSAITYGDGKPDLAVALTGPNRIEVFLGNGDGSVTYRSYADLALPEGVAYYRSPTDFGPSSLATADLNGDGKLDLIALFEGAGLVFLGNGDGTFQPLGSPLGSLGFNPQAMTVADLNGDGVPDLVIVGTYEDGSPLVLIGKGGGTFHPPIPLGFRGTSVTVADFDGDGVPDIATVLGNSVAVARGNGDGTFGVPVRYTIGEFCTVIVSGDFNGDGRPDLAVSDASSNLIFTLVNVSQTTP